ncbi:MAG: DUF2865 domain-containing protein [Rhizobiales bacterium]|nr:DUF2865 domain-containing protein [Hyphomicrobiales bacterium]
MNVFLRLRGAVASVIGALLFAGAPALAAGDSYFCQSLQADYIALGKQLGNGGDLRQQLANAQAAARRAGCQRFLFFGPKPSKSCPQLLAKVDQLQSRVMRSGGGVFGFGFFGRPDASQERNRLRTTLTAYGCDVPVDGYGGGLRTICVRTCDGYYFPISSNGSQKRFKVDQAVCQSMYGPGQAEIYYYRYPSDDVSIAVSMGGRQYGKQPFAFNYRSTFDASCAASFHGPNGQAIASTLKPATAKLIAAYLAPKGKLKRQLDTDMPAMAGDEMPPDQDVPDDGALAVAAEPAATAAVRTIGPSYYYEPLGSRSGPPPKIAGFKEPVLGDRMVGVRELPPNAPVAASILPLPTDGR